MCWPRSSWTGIRWRIPILGTRESIRAPPKTDIRAYHGQRFRFSDMVVAAAGNVDHDEMRELLLGAAACARTGAEPQRPPAETGHDAAGTS